MGDEDWDDLDEWTRADTILVLLALAMLAVGLLGLWLNN